jgi:hypothetical protein
MPAGVTDGSYLAQPEMASAESRTDLGPLTMGVHRRRQPMSEQEQARPTAVNGGLSTNGLLELGAGRSSSCSPQACGQ